MDINKKLQLASQYQKEGNLQQAEYLFKEILEIEPANCEALHLLGIIYYQLQNYDDAIYSFKKAVQFNPTNALIFSNLGTVLKEKGLLDDAIGCYQRAIELNPTFTAAYSNLGCILQERGQVDDAVTIYQKALLLNPNYADAHYNLATLLKGKGNFDGAVTHYKRAIQLNPKFTEAFFNLGVSYLETNQLHEATVCFQKVLQLNPNFSGAYYNLGIVLQDKGLFNEAIANYQKAIHLNPNLAAAYNNLGMTFKDEGQINEAEVWIRRALQLEPDNSTYYSNLVLIMNYNGSHNTECVYHEHLNFSKRYEITFSSSILPHTNTRDPSRRLKIGYVSPDFRRHAVAYFIEPVITAHKRDNFEVFCYSNNNQYDEVTKRIQKHADHWHNIEKIPDEEVAELIRRDGIDILIDLAGHTAGNRLLVFARKPAPIQINWIGYPPTTGLATIDYKIVDNFTDPLGETEQFYTEKLMRLPECFAVYLPDKNCPKVGPLPALSAGYITFGSLNNFAKVTPEAFSLWARILNAVPHSRLMMQGKSFSDITVYEQIINMFGEKGIDKERIILQYWKKSPMHLESYNSIDIGLDTFPFNGLTTSCEALWMGVPVITLAGTAYASRAGVSLLSNIGLPDLIAKTDDEYANIAIKLSSDIGKLEILRQGLRDMMKSSSLCDAKRFTANLEMCYRKMWETWCQSI